MDRLSHLTLAAQLSAAIVALLALGGCAEGDRAPQPSRVAAVEAKGRIATAQEWCDRYYDAGNGPLTVLPPVVAARPGSALSPGLGKRWIWLNLWATWCAPCLREMPLIERWIVALHREEVPVDLWYLSVDESAGDLAAFFKANPEIAAQNSLRLSDGDALGAWLTGIGLKAETAIPVNVLVGPSGKARCLRTGSISDSDYAVVRAFLKKESGN
jgi:thiol-disulfide isomerase/thioredoxin